MELGGRLVEVFLGLRKGFGACFGRSEQLLRGSKSKQLRGRRSASAISSTSSISDTTRRGSSSLDVSGARTSVACPPSSWAKQRHRARRRAPEGPLRPFEASQVLASILSFAKQMSEDSADGKSVRELVVTVPSDATLRQRQAQTVVSLLWMARQ